MAREEAKSIHSDSYFLDHMSLYCVSQWVSLFLTSWSVLIGLLTEALQEYALQQTMLPKMKRTIIN